MQSFRATTPDLLRGERGWMSQIKTAAPGGGRKMFLTSPFIDQAISLRTRIVSAMGILKQLRPVAGFVYEPSIVWDYASDSLICGLPLLSPHVTAFVQQVDQAQLLLAWSRFRAAGLMSSIRIGRSCHECWCAS